MVGPQRWQRNRGRTASRPLDIPPRGWLDIAARVRVEVADDHTTLSAAGVAFYLFLSFIPGLSAVVSVFGLVAEPADVQQRVQSLFSTLPTDARQLVVDQLSSIVDQTGRALTVGLVSSIALSLWSASSGVGHLMEAIGVAYDQRERRGMVRRRLLALSVTAAAVLGLGVVIGLVALSSWLSRRVELAGWITWLVRLAWMPIVLVGFVAGLAALYRVALSRRAAKWRWVSTGSVVAVVIWLVASFGFQLYVTNFGSYNKTYGSLAAVVILLFWLFLTAFAILLGAQINAELEHQTEIGTTVGIDRPLGQRQATMADTVATP